MLATAFKAITGFAAAFGLVLWLSAPGKEAQGSPPFSLPASWIGGESLDLKGRRMASWSSNLDVASETRQAAAHFRSRGLTVDEAFSEESGGMITLVKDGHRLIINIVSCEEGSDITLVSAPVSKEVAP
ncbi:MAG: hypothetical protein AB7F75_02215 [Planctomycetota bacterium]